MKTLFSYSLMFVALAAVQPALAQDLKDGIIIRRVAPTGTCSVASIFTDPGDLDQHNRAHHLSVNCTAQTSNKNNYLQFTGGLLAGRYCVARVADIIRKGGRVSTAPVPNNQLHCLVNNIPAKDLSSIVTLY